MNPTNVLGTSGGNTAFFNEAKSGGTLNLATFQYPNTDLGLKGEASGGTLSYDYTVPTTGTITGNSVIQDTLVSGAPMMTQYTYANTVQVAAKPIITGVENIQLPVDFNNGVYDLSSGVTAKTFDGDGKATYTVTDENGNAITNAAWRRGKSRSGLPQASAAGGCEIFALCKEPRQVPPGPRASQSSSRVPQRGYKVKWKSTRSGNYVCACAFKRC